MVERCARELTELESTGSRCTASSATSSATSSTCPPPTGGPADRRLPRRHDRQLHAGRAAPLPAPRRARCCGPASTTCCSAPTSSRTRACSRPPTTTRQGVTAEFNRNVLRVINRELGADFDVDAFEHVAFFDAEREWIEMRLRVDRAPAGARSRPSGSRSSSPPREELRTEISAKFTRERLERDLGGRGARARARADGRRRAVRALALDAAPTADEPGTARARRCAGPSDHVRRAASALRQALDDHRLALALGDAHRLDADASCRASRGR